MTTVSFASYGGDARVEFEALDPDMAILASRVYREAYYARQKGRGQAMFAAAQLIDKNGVPWSALPCQVRAESYSVRRSTLM